MDKITAALNKKVAGVKVLYLALIVALVLGFYAFRTVRSGALDEAPDANTDADPDAGYTDALPNMQAGTVYAAAPQYDVQGDEAPDANAIDTNDAWVKQGITYLTSINKANTIQAQTALQKYLAGSDLSFGQGSLVDTVVGKFGSPPTLTDVGRVLPQRSKPSTPRAPSVTNISGRKAAVSVDTPAANGSKISGYDWQFSSNSYFAANDKVVSSKSNRTDIAVGLANHDYWIRVRAKSDRGNSEWSAPTKFRSGK